MVEALDTHWAAGRTTEKLSLHFSFCIYYKLPLRPPKGVTRFSGHSLQQPCVGSQEIIMQVG